MADAPAATIAINALVKNMMMIILDWIVWIDVIILVGNESRGRGVVFGNGEVIKRLSSDWNGRSRCVCLGDFTMVYECRGDVGTGKTDMHDMQGGKHGGRAPSCALTMTISIPTQSLTNVDPLFGNTGWKSLGGNTWRGGVQKHCLGQVGVCCLCCTEKSTASSPRCDS